MENKNTANHDFCSKSVDLYISNQAFIEKGIFTISSAAIPSLLFYSNNIDFSNIFALMFVAAIFGFLITIILQIISARKAKESCKLDLDQTKQEEATKLAEYVDNIENIIFIIFITSMSFAICSILINSYFSN